MTVAGEKGIAVAAKGSHDRCRRERHRGGRRGKSSRWPASEVMTVADEGCHGGGRRGKSSPRTSMLPSLLTAKRVSPSIAFPSAMAA